MLSVAIIGGGVSGIAAARACLEENLQITIFEKRPVLGGIWSMDNTPVFDNLTSNTSVFEAAYSDLPVIRTKPHPNLSPDDSLCFRKTEMYEYLQNVVNSSPVRSSAILEATVTSIIRNVSDKVISFTVHYTTPTTSVQCKTFDKLILATGIHNTPFIPSPKHIPGIDTTNMQIMHVCKYRNPAQLQNKRVLVIGGAVSGCEAAADMAAGPPEARPAHVTLSSRSSRYIVAKQRQNHLFLCRISTRFHNLRAVSGRYGRKEANKEFMRHVPDFSVNTDYNIPAPVGDIVMPFVPNFVPVNVKLLNASKQGDVLDWNIGGVKRLLEDSVEFNDGRVEKFDTVILATGYKLDMSYLEDHVEQKLRSDKSSSLCDLYDHTFHPELDGMAMIGLFPPGASFIAMADCQARWAASVLSGAVDRESDEVMWGGIRQYRKLQKDESSHFVRFGYEVVDLFARHGGFEIDLRQYPEYSKMLLFGPLVPAQFRLFGRGKKDEARKEFEKQMIASGFKVGDCSITKEQMDEIRAVSRVMDEKNGYVKGLSHVLEYLTVESKAEEESNVSRLGQCASASASTLV